MKLSRREFVRSMLVFPGVPLVLGLHRVWTPVAWAQDDSSGGRSAEWVQSGGDFAAGVSSSLAITGAGALALDAAPAGTYTSTAVAASFPFNAVALIWRGTVPDGASLSFSVRASQDGQAWGPWLPAQESADLATEPDVHPSDLVMVEGAYLQWSARFSGASGASPLLQEVRTVYIDSMAGPTAAEAETVVPAAEPGSVNPPPIITRAGWGCRQPYSSPNWPPEYRRVQKVIIHHTATTNDYTDGAGQVRAVWYYHANSLGWGDIGYNFLIDRYGYIYQGRYGGDDVIGGHASPYNPGSAGVSLIGNFEEGHAPPAMSDALVRLVTWLTYRRDIDPRGESYFIDRVRPNIMGHKDAGWTACPGRYFYPTLPEIRQRVWDAFPLYGDGWVSHNTPPILGLGETVDVDVTITNRGRLTWTAGGSNPVRLGYHWYRADNTPVIQDPADDHRTPLLADVPYGKDVTLRARLTSPREKGVYTLRWDLVEEGASWFEWRGVPTLDLSITVSPPVLAVSPATLYFLADADTGPRPINLTVANAGRGTFQWSASCNQPWCQLDRLTGDTPGSIQVTIDKTELALGETHRATITVTSEIATGSPRTVNVAFVYSAEPLDHTYLTVLPGGGLVR